MNLAKPTAVWAVTGALGLATLAGGAYAVFTTQPEEGNRPGITLPSSAPAAAPGQNGTVESQAPTNPTRPTPSSPATSTAPPTGVATPRTTKPVPSAEKQTLKRTTSTYRNPAPVPADSPQSAESGD